VLAIYGKGDAFEAKIGVYKIAAENQHMAKNYGKNLIMVKKGNEKIMKETDNENKKNLFLTLKSWLKKV
jgi:hypothetical protein